MKSFKTLAVIIDRKSGVEIDSFEFDYELSWGYEDKDSLCTRISARGEALDIFEQKQKYQPNLRKHKDYYVDCVFL
ncbi:hypothetical protein KLEP7_gp39 [Pseudaeromonas phage vB_PpeM_ KLEP7]|nr:hypothetical protein KLEP7_gp39 [Pseudaeromonas phage vB_PpeM_ KLEP7]